MTWEEICKKEPRLSELYADARRITSRGDPNFCANFVWYRTLKPRLLFLVGWHAERPELRTSEIYDFVYHYIYKVLPSCRNCLCMRPELIFGKRKPLFPGRRRCASLIP
jgi:hypothetical protein